MTRSAVLLLGSGFIGSEIAHALVAAGREVVVLTRSEPDGRRLELLRGCVVVVADADNTRIVAEHLNGVSDIVYAIGSSSPFQSDLAPDADIGVVVPPLIRLLELLREHPQARLTYLSSGGTVYGNSAVQPIGEDTDPRPVSSYGIIKWTCEQYVRMYVTAYGVTGRILRLGNVYGRGQPAAKGQGVIGYLMRTIATQSVLPLYGADQSIRDYVHVVDVASAVAGLIGRDDFPPVLNVGSGEGRSLSEVCALAESVTGRTVNVRHFGMRSFDVEKNVLDVSRLKRVIDYTPRSLADGLRETWDAFCESDD